VTPLGVGIVGCGTISGTYLELARLFRSIEVRAVSDTRHEAATAQAARYGVRALSVDALLAADDIDIVVNLTVPDAHHAVTQAILAAGKHAYSEKPLALTLEEATALRTLAQGKGLRVGVAPDTFLGAAHQQARAEIDAGGIGRVVAGTAHVLSHGMEHWHEAPDFFYRPGAGPMLDVGPYFVANLVQLVGPVRRVAALASTPEPTRTILSAPRRGEVIEVTTPTNIHALLDFASGATVTLSTSWDVWAHRHGPLELYGTEGALFLPDPNWFGGTVEKAGSDGVIRPLAPWPHPFGQENQVRDEQPRANYRGAGLADMAQAIVEGRPHRCGLDLAVHVLDVLTAILVSGEEGRFVELATSCERPAPLPPEAAVALMTEAAATRLPA
jgi:predicted dehydrogenase